MVFYNSLVYACTCEEVVGMHVHAGRMGLCTDTTTGRLASLLALSSVLFRHVGGVM